MTSTGDEQAYEDVWTDGEGDLRWEAVTRTLGFIIVIAALLSATAAWLMVSGQLVDGLCQTPTASTDKTLLDACQGRMEIDGPQISALADAALPATIVLASVTSALVIVGAVALSGVAERSRDLAARIEAPMIWAARALACIAGLGITWLAYQSVERLLYVRSLI